MLLLRRVQEVPLQMANSLKKRCREAGRKVGRTQVDNSHVKIPEVNCEAVFQPNYMYSMIYLFATSLIFEGSKVKLQLFCIVLAASLKF